MKARKDLLTRDDWDLTRKSLEGQRGSMLIQLDTLEAAIVACENRVRSFPEPKQPDTDDDGDPVNSEQTIPPTIFSDKQKKDFIDRKDKVRKEVKKSNGRCFAS